MQAIVGDLLHIHSRKAGLAEQVGEIIEVRGSAGSPPYLVRFDDGHEGLVYPGPDSLVRHPEDLPRQVRRDSSSAR
ncbi:DUF1918 domain-containing protein [Saccharothrix violaceirubra]|uniref:DUF1918 domain-containing protein n=1 Tax=Saccharothrix violaceirubra TaxID=413306 RepID=A0A7W7SYG9_9PSEU|nr:DUF1918 domain-containing protein [Saccharothrix violaceirubra]MBB4963011.1 hypothetical protein [Saccharothrix violaceirubra]